MVSDEKSSREAYDAAKKELQQLLAKKRAIDKNLVNLENSIYLYEGAYLEDTVTTGNIVKGFDGYLRSGPSGLGGGSSGSLGHHSHGSISRRGGMGKAVEDHDRIFSNSSKTLLKSLSLKEKEIAIANGSYVASEDENAGLHNGTRSSTPAVQDSSKKKKSAGTSTASHKKRPRSRADSEATSDEDTNIASTRKKGRMAKAEE